jgi:hypothetical protein
VADKYVALKCGQAVRPPGAHDSRVKRQAALSSPLKPRSFHIPSSPPPPASERMCT